MWNFPSTAGILNIPISILRLMQRHHCFTTLLPSDSKPNHASQPSNHVSPILAAFSEAFLGIPANSTWDGLTWFILRSGTLKCVRNLLTLLAVHRLTASKGKNRSSKHRLTFFVQQRLLLPTLLDPINRHKAWQALKSESMSVDVHQSNTWLRESYSDIRCLKTFVVLLSSPMRTCVMPSFRSFVRRAPANLAVSQACFILKSRTLSVNEASLASFRSV